MTIKVERRGEVIEIHEDALAQHEAAGWRQVTEAPKQDSEAPRRGRPSKSEQ